jgi:ribosomal protein S27E
MKIAICPQCKNVEMIYNNNPEAKHKCPKCGFEGISLIDKGVRR